MTIYDMIIDFIRKRTTIETFMIDLTPLFKSLHYSVHDFDNFLKDLQEQNLITYTIEILTTDLKPVGITIDGYNQITSISYDKAYIVAFNAMLTFNGTKYKIEN